jgi:hypothetical protein
MQDFTAIQPLHAKPTNSLTLQIVLLGQLIPNTRPMLGRTVQCGVPRTGLSRRSKVLEGYEDHTGGDDSGAALL